MLMLDPCVFTDSVHLQLAMSLGGDLVDMHRSITALRRDVLVHGIPGDPLYVVAMLHDLFDAFSVTRGEYSRDVIGTASKDVFPGGTPREIVNLHCGASVESGERLGDYTEDGGPCGYRKVNRGFQYSLSYWASSGEISEPYVLVFGVLEGAQIMIMPSG